MSNSDYIIDHTSLLLSQVLILSEVFTADVKDIFYSKLYLNQGCHFEFFITALSVTIFYSELLQ